MADSKTKLTRFTGRSLARLIRHVGRTSDIVYDPPDLMQRLVGAHPAIVASWHGQFMMLVMLKPPEVPVSAMVARHGDAELIGEAMRMFDVELIRGAGAGDRKKDRGGAAALRGSVRALNDGSSIVMTADVPPGPARKCGIGIIMMAQLSGRPIVPVGIASSRFTSLDTWSRMTINLPYSKLAFAMGEPVLVPRDADAATLERLRGEVEHALNDSMARAYKLAGADIERATPLEMLAASKPPAPGRGLRTYAKSISALRPLAPLLLKYRAGKGKEDPARRNERLGNPTRARPEGQLAWVHAASVGETNVALPVIERMLKDNPGLNVMLTSGTMTSAALAARRLPQGAFHQFIPLDAPQYVAGFLDHWRPDFGIFTESEIWPNLILAASERKIPLALINARMSPRSMKRWRRSAKLGRQLFARFDVALVQNDRVARMLRFLGTPRVIVSGNLKIDAPPPPVDDAALAKLRAAIGNRPVLLASSTHKGEDGVTGEAHVKLRAALPELLTIIVPRHPDRAPAIAQELAALGLACELRSAAAVPSSACAVFIADTIGELGTFYALAPVSFIGGSLIPHGGQNPIEAVRHGSAVLTGPHTHNFVEAYSALTKNGGAAVVSNADELAAAALRLLSNEAARSAALQSADDAVQLLSGALETTMAALQPYLPSGKVAAGAD
jgi:3-deoxy-D-manno-octulosonic-acid transferase